ncbi:MAG: helical backbone metal receptor [Bacteroidota bacterium]
MFRATIKNLSIILIALLSSCSSSTEKSEVEDVPQKIVSISGATTEVLCVLGLQKEIVGVDVTSTYPETIAALPRVGHNRNMSSEAIIALKPTMVVGTDENVKPELIEQLKSAHIHVMLFSLQQSVEGSKQLIKMMADSLGKTESAQVVINAIDDDLKQKVQLALKPKVLFIYARGAGTMMVAGNNTPANTMIQLAGGENAVNDFEDFKPLTPESLLKANPDVILMFTSGLESLGGMEGLLKVPGVAMTNAGKNKQVIEMDGQLLTGFGPRVGKAIVQLSTKLNELKTN